MSSTPQKIEKVGVLFVCLGNICRSPLAKGVFVHEAREWGVLDLLDIDSCGTGHWHIGKPADSRSVEVARRHGFELPHCARQLDAAADFARFQWLIAMDRDNRDELLYHRAPKERVHLMRSFDPAMRGEPEHRLDVPDPYYGGGDGFQRVYEMLTVASEHLLNAVLQGADRSSKK